MGKDDKKKRMPASFVTGAIALVFLIVGYQVALFLNRAAISKVLADRHSPDTVYIAVGGSTASGATGGGSGAKVGSPGKGSGSGKGSSPGRGNSSGKGDGVKIVSDARGFSVDQQSGERREWKAREQNDAHRREVESFRFNPNTVSVEDLQRLGFSLKQAQSIDSYRAKGGVFRRKSDFAKSFVVADSVYTRLEPYIDIPLVDLNLADSTALDALPGIGGWFALKIIEHRQRLGGFSYKEQLMDIWRFDRQKYDALQDLVTIGRAGIRPYRLWSLPEDSLRMHPYIGNYAAHGIAVFRENMPVEQWSVEALAAEGILKEDMAQKLSRCVIAPPGAD